MKKLIDWGYVKNTSKRLIFIATINLIFGIFFIAVYNFVNFIEDENYYELERVPSLCITAYLFISIIGSYLMAFRALNFTRNRNKADFVYSMPMSRQQIFTSTALSAVIMQMFTLAVIAAIDKYLAVSVADIFIYTESPILFFLFFSAVSLVTMAASFLSASVTGKAFSHFVITMGILALPAALPMIRYFILQGKAYYEFAPLFKPSLYSITGLFGFIGNFRYYFIYIPGIIFTTFLAIAYFAAGYFLFKGRTGEHSGIYARNDIVHHIIKSILAFIIVLIASSTAIKYDLFYSGVSVKHIIQIIVCLAAAVIALYTYDLFVHRAYMKKNKNILIFPILVLLAFGLVYGVDKYVDYEHYMKIDEERIESVNIILNEEVSTIYRIEQYMPLEYNCYTSSKTDIKDRELIKDITNTLNAAEDKDYNIDTFGNAYLLIKFTYKSGRHLYRYVPIPDEGGEMTDESLFMRIMKDEDHFKAITQIAPTENVEKFSINNKIILKKQDKKASEIYETFYEEFVGLTDNQKETILLLNYSEPMKTYGVIVVYSRVGGRSYANYYMITEHTPDAANKYMEYANTMHNMDVDSLISSLNDNPDDFVYMIHFNNKTIFNGYLEENEEYGDNFLRMLAERGYEKPSADGNVVRIEYMNVGYPNSFYINVDDYIIGELERSYEEQQILTGG